MVNKKENELQDVQELQVIGQLIDNITIITDKLEKAYNDKDSIKFKQAKDEILKSQKQIENMLK
jgi:hypothetical protein